MRGEETRGRREEKVGEKRSGKKMRGEEKRRDERREERKGARGEGEEKCMCMFDCVCVGVLFCDCKGGLGSEEVAGHHETDRVSVRFSSDKFLCFINEIIYISSKEIFLRCECTAVRGSKQNSEEGTEDVGGGRSR